MKKILALVMAIVMMMAIAVPAFATKSFDNTFVADPALVPDANQTLVKTDISSAGVGTYTVTIPASISIVWKSTEAVSAKYYVTTQLLTGYTLDVAASTTGVMAVTAQGSTNTKTIGFNVTGNTAVNVESAITDAEYAIAVAVPEANWKDAPVDNYEGPITFTAEVKAPVVTP